MTRRLALLRAVNVGPASQLDMQALRDLALDLGFTGARTLLRSGNLVFDAEQEGGIGATLEAALAERLGVKTEVLVRDGAEWSAMMAANPFAEAARDDPSHLLVMALRDAPPAQAVADLQAAITGREQVRAVGRHAYLAYPDGIGRSKLTAVLIERRLGTRGTARNWNTVLKLAEMLAG
jgi:uncharacterized protein (DUF1697 family)